VTPSEDQREDWMTIQKLYAEAGLEIPRDAAPPDYS
jgi:hypothetical protein